jgi:hypothetical protein
MGASCSSPPLSTTCNKVDTLKCALFLPPMLALSPLAQAAPFDETKLTASDAASEDYFGYSVGISGATAIVGAYGNSDAGYQSGSAYLFNATTGAQIAKLTASDAAGGDYFGHSVAIFDNTAIVGAFADDDAGFNSGLAYVFASAAPPEVPLPAGIWLLGSAAGLLVLRRKRAARAA